MNPGRWAALIALTLASSGLAAPALAADKTAPESPVAVAPSWAVPTPSTEQDPERVVGLTRSAGRVRVVAVFARGGHPVVRVWNERTRTDAVARVAAAQLNPSLVSIETEQRQQFLDPVRSTRISNDTLRPSQWALDRLQAESVWTRSRGAGVTVAVIDTGVAVHEDLGGAFVPGKDFAASGDGRNDGHGHGTHVAGIIAATTDNAKGVAGLAPDVTLMPVKVLADNGSGYSSAVSSGIIWATDNGADIISMSLGGGYDAGEGVAVAYAISRGVIVIAAAGNERASGSPTSYPAAFPGVVAVGATTSTDAIASYSNSGAYVDIAAPGSAIWSSLPTGYAAWSGTSMATPYVSAAAAVVLARARVLNVVVNVTDVLTATADDLGPTGRDDDFGAGLVNPVGALDTLGAGAVTLAAPTALNATATSTSRADVIWTEPTDITGITSYRVTATPSGATCSAPVGTSACSLTNLAASTTYSLSVRSIGAVASSTPSAPVTVTTMARLDAAGDTMATATEMPGASVEEFIDVASDVDWWSTYLSSPGSLTVTLDNLPADYDLYVYNDLGQLVSSSRLAGTSTDIATLNTVVGRYHLQVIPYGGSYSDSIAYRLSTQFTSSTPPPPPAEPADLAGDTQATATDLEPGAIRDTITAGDEDYWTFTLGSTHDVALALTELPTDFDIQLVDITGTVLASGVRAGTQPEYLSTQLTAGVYFIRVFGYSGAYNDTQPYALALSTVRVIPPDLGGDTFASATPMDSTLVAVDRMDTVADVDFWSFVVPSLSRVDLLLSQVSAGLDLVVYGADGAVLGRSNRPGDADEAASLWLTPGTYVVRIRSASRGISSDPYRLAVAMQELGRTVLDQAGDTNSTATALPVGGVDELIHAASDRDYWAFTISATTRVSLTLSSLPADYDLVLTRAEGRVLARSSHAGLGNEEISARLAAGRYIVRVVPRGGQWSTADYRLSILEALPAGVRAIL